jgi:hypothetical protein
VSTELVEETEVEINPVESGGEVEARSVIKASVSREKYNSDAEKADC